MIRLVFICVRLSAVAAVVLVLGQIPVGNLRISDHVGAALKSTYVQRPVHWISSHFNIMTGYHKPEGEKGRAGLADSKRSRPDSSEASTEHNESDKGRLSGLLKR